MCVRTVVCEMAFVRGCVVAVSWLAAVLRGGKGAKAVKGGKGVKGVKAKGDAPKQDRTTDLPLTKRVLYH